MERKNNYEIQAAQARALFCARDLDAVAREHGLRQEGQWLHLRLLGEPYRVSRRNGRIEREEDGRWLPADGFDETLTIFDLLCDAKPGRHAAGTWKTTLDFGGQVHRGLLENEKPDALELLYDKDPARLRAACETLGGEALPGADVSYALPFFEDLRIVVQFWHGDEEFSPSPALPLGRRRRPIPALRDHVLRPSPPPHQTAGPGMTNKQKSRPRGGSFILAPLGRKGSCQPQV